MSDEVAEALGLSDDPDTVTCRECNEDFAQITQSHVRTQHGITLQAYRERYPEAPVQSEDVRERSGWNSETHDEATRKAISESVAESHRDGDYDGDA